jgi:acyl-Coa thioesterase superfamily protein/acyl-CoA thioesterase superfamily protein
LKPFFLRDGERFVATESARGPWSRDLQHGGPPAALLVRAMEQVVGDGMLLTRLTFDYTRPVPIGPVLASAETWRAGAKVQRLRASLTTADGTALVSATAVALRTAPLLPAALGADQTPPPPPEASTPFEFIFFKEPVAYHRAVEARLARGTWGKGPLAVWMRTLVPLVEGETPSSIQRALIVADSASGVAVVIDHERQTFVNADLTVALHRAPQSEWICLDAATIAEPHGVGLTRARLWDEHGVIGVSLQNCLLDVRPA